MRTGTKFIALLWLVLCLSCTSSRASQGVKLYGTWLPKNYPEDSFGFKLMENGEGTVTSKQIIKENSQTQPFNYEVRGSTLAFRFFNEEGQPGAWQEVAFTVNRDELLLDQTIRPLSAKVFTRSD